ncbi:TPA: Rha family transcriptional regulator [Pseudomonas aeruginosa]|uniref:Rha family transcriptional regulator n=2 Tax=Pseudomonas aeruginosa TaxID=287 RepID=UPI000690DEF9|nr:Rha family transcriptional regulator [Pseudomonas aeruginosa]MCT7340217.1 Rha family transcriptional regulator [Pseudomonas aeruginosa]MCT7340966.1 Rha family transcriptional regulator [Pseudomonas aeruginosa]HBO6208451.1 Rha family transcriptional regulator [Pseudomonas aeruginosa]
MKAIAPVTTPVLVELTDGQPTTTSLDVAAHFRKQHKTVLRAIANLECSPEFNQHNFAPIEYTDAAGRKYTQYRMTRDGFTFLCMGFTGKEAAKWKEAYINAFNQMEHTLKHGAPAKPKRQPKQITDGLSKDQQEAIKALVKARVDELPESRRAKAAITCWSALKSKFGCTYKEIAPEQFTEAVSLVARVVLEGEWMGKSTAFSDIIGRPLTRIERWMVYTDFEGNEQYKPIPYDACVMTHRELIQAMVTPGDMPVSTEEMFEFAMAALANLKGRSDYQARQLKHLTDKKRQGGKQ